MSIQERFDQYHRDNPHVYDSLVEMARELRSENLHGSIAMLFEVIRYRGLRDVKHGHNEPKLSNSYRSRYARLIMDNEPDLKGFFKIKRLTSR